MYICLFSLILAPTQRKCCRQFSHELQRFETANHSVHITGCGTVDHAAMFAALVNYYPVFFHPPFHSQNSLLTESLWWCEQKNMSKFYITHPTRRPHPAHSFLDPLLASRKNIFFLHVGEKEEKSFLKVFRRKKKKKKGCYLIKEAAINLSPSSAALLHIWPFTAAAHCCSFLLRPGWDLWFLLLVSHVV